MTPEQIKMLKRLIDAHELGEKLDPRVLTKARRILREAVQAQPETAIEGQPS